jgi:hypothetical protein
MKDFVLLKTYVTRLDAAVHKTKLDANNIKSMIVGDDEGGMAPFPFQPTPNGVQLFVSKNNYKKAVALLSLKK